MVSFTLRGRRGSQAGVTITWSSGGTLSGDEDAATMVRALAESHDGQLVGTGGGPYTTHRHLRSPYSAYALMRMVFMGGRPELVAGSLPPPPPSPPGAVRWYARRRAMPADPHYPRVVFQDNDDLENEDWPKRTWDLPTDRAEFLAFLKASRTSVAEFKTWPIYRWHVDRIPWLRDLQDDEGR